MPALQPPVEPQVQGASSSMVGFFAKLMSLRPLRICLRGHTFIVTSTAEPASHRACTLMALALELISWALPAYASYYADPGQGSRRQSSGTPEPRATLHVDRILLRIPRGAEHEFPSHACARRARGSPTSLSPCALATSGPARAVSLPLASPPRPRAPTQVQAPQSCRTLMS